MLRSSALVSNSIEFNYFQQDNLFFFGNENDCIVDALLIRTIMYFSLIGELNHVFYFN